MDVGTRFSTNFWPLPLHPFVAGFGIETSAIAPDSAIVLIDSDKTVYPAPQCVSNKIETRFSRATIGTAKEAGFKIDADYVNTGVFAQNIRSLSGIMLEKIGFPDPL